MVTKVDTVVTNLDTKRGCQQRDVEGWGQEGWLVEQRHRSVRQLHLPLQQTLTNPGEREFCIDNLLVRVYFIIEMILVEQPCAMGL